MTYRSTKTYGPEIGLSCAFRQWRAHSHCRFLHGYALSVRFEFEAEVLENGWVVDFGGLNSLKATLEGSFDHKTVVSEDDPHLELFRSMEKAGIAQVVVLPAVGCEAFAEIIYKVTAQWLMDSGFGPRCRLMSVEVREHGANSAIYLGDKK